MRVKVFKQKGGTFKVLLTNRVPGDYRVKLLPRASAKTLETLLPQEIKAIHSTTKVYLN